jgi:hypothetical protein
MPQIGFHYFPDDVHYRAADLHAWLPELKALGARWLTLLGSLTRAVPEPFITGLKQAYIEPIIHIHTLPTENAALTSLLGTYARWGVRYVVFGHELNLRTQWPTAEWGQPNLVERLIERLTPVWRAQEAAGLEMVFPPLRAGGDYWDTAFLEAALAALQRQGRGELIQQLTFAVNLFSEGKPANWGAGGLHAWPAARPYATLPNTQDQRGFHLFDWYNEIITARAGQTRPLLCLAGGPRLGEAALTSENSAKANAAVQHATVTQEILNLVEAARLPANLVNINFWLLAAGAESSIAREAWYQPDGTQVPAITALKQFAQRHAAKNPARAKFRPKTNHGKLFAHYLLLPTFEWGLSEWHWQKALEYVKLHQPTCGFSQEEAAQAERVTLFGNEQGLSLELEHQLQSIGCEVERVFPVVE